MRWKSLAYAKPYHRAATRPRWCSYRPQNVRRGLGYTFAYTQGRKGLKMAGEGLLHTV